MYIVFLRSLWYFGIKTNMLEYVGDRYLTDCRNQPQRSKTKHIHIISISYILPLTKVFKILFRLLVAEIIWDTHYHTCPERYSIPNR